MIIAGILDAEKVGDRWLIDRASVERRAAAKAPAGRLLSHTNAWAFLLLAGQKACMEKDKGPSRWINNLNPWTRSRIHSRLASATTASLAPRLRGRAAVYRLRAHTSDLLSIASESGIVRAGVSAASDYSVDLTSAGELEAYVPDKQLPKLVKKYCLEKSTNPNLTLHVVVGRWPFPPSCKVVPAPVAALDLLEADDERSRRAGIELLKRLDGQ